MPKITYVKKRFKSASAALIEKCNDVIDEYSTQGFSLTLRQLFYQFVARAFIPNSLQEYKRLGSVLNDARLAGLVDWNAIEDRTRFVRSLAHWDNPHEIVEACSHQFRVDRWSEEYQECRVEVWIEKDALVGVFEDACEDMDVPLFSCRGYTSQSEVWRAARRLSQYQALGQTPVILHFGDHDPSGIDMTRDISDRMETFGVPLEVRRMALNMDQVDEYSPPPNPAKTTDARFQTYVVKYGEDSWELDAMEPSVLAALVQREVASFRDEKGWKAANRDIKKGRKAIAEVAGQL